MKGGNDHIAERKSRFEAIRKPDPGANCPQVNCPRFTIVRWNFAQGVFPLECARSFSLGCRSWQRLRPLLCHSLHFGMKRRHSVTVLAIPLFGSISARGFITSSDRSGTGKAPRAASFVRKKLAPAASGAPCLGSDNLGSQLFFSVKGRTAAGRWRLLAIRRLSAQIPEPRRARLL
jgi:hypothetical protein